MDPVHSESFGEVTEVADSLPQLMKILRNTVYGQSVHAWRGHADVDWRLDSSAVRYLKDQWNIDPQCQDLEKHLIEYEKSRLDQARMAGYGCYEERKLGDLELLSVLQHYGDATRLVDFTYNAFIALWFACRKCPDKTGLLIGAALDYSAHKELSFKEAQEPVHEIIKTKGCYGDKSIFTWQPLYLLERMRVQQSFFIFSRTVCNQAGSLAVISLLPQIISKNMGIQEHQYLVKIGITPSLKTEMREYCKSLFGYDEASLFPDDEASLFPDIAGFSVAHSWKAKEA